MGGESGGYKTAWEGLTEENKRGLDWAPSANCYPEDGLLTAPSGERYRTAFLQNLPVDVRGVVLVPAELSLDVMDIDIISKK